MIWNKHKQQEESYVASEDFAIRLLDIQSRIANLKSSLGWDQKSNKSTQTQSKPVVASTPELQSQTDVRAQKESELDDLKAKLLGKKN